MFLFGKNYMNPVRFDSVRANSPLAPTTIYSKTFGVKHFVQVEQRSLQKPYVVWSRNWERRKITYWPIEACSALVKSHSDYFRYRCYD